MKRKALFIGVNEYKDPEIRNLSCSLRDAMSMHDIFEELGYQTDLLENPSKGDVFQAVRKMTSDMVGGDQFLFYFAGHGFTDSGQHLLFCTDDLHEHLRFHRAGIPFDLLELETRNGGYDRVFLLDACQSDFLTGTRGEDATTRDMIAIGEMVPKAEMASGAFYVLRSCSKYEHALEIASRRHGLFTLAMIGVLRQSKNAGLELRFDDSLRETVRESMWGIAASEGISAKQTPESDGRGGRQVLMGGFQRPAHRMQPAEQSFASEAFSYVICPLCGKHNLVTETFRCSACGRDHICLSHFSSEEKSCAECAQAALTKRQVAAKEFFENGKACLYGRIGTKKDPVEAEKCYRKAAELGCVDAQYELGDMYSWGQYIPKSEEEAAKWYQKAAERGHVDAQRRLGVMYISGSGVPKSAVEAAKWYRKAAEQGDAAAQYHLAGMYCEGEGVSQSYEEAVKWYRKSAEQGDFDAQEKLGRMYEEGLGVPQSYEEAAKWYQKAVDYDDELSNDSVERSLHRVREKIVEWQMVDPEKLYAQGVALMKGDGCLKSEAEAFKCFKRAALVGHVKAIEELAECYYRGRGVDKNQDEAFEWFSRSNTENAKKALAEIIGAKKRCIRITSYRSFGLKKQEYLRLLNEEMPANVKRIEAARSRCADKSSDEEYLKAKDDQRALMMKQTLMQAELEDVYPSDFADATTDMVMPGVTVVVATKGGDRTLTVLGEWDNDEAMKIYSSMTQIAKNMMGKMVGDSFELPDEDGNLALATIKEIRSPSAEVREWMKLPAGVKI